MINAVIKNNKTLNYNSFYIKKSIILIFRTVLENKNLIHTYTFEDTYFSY